MSASKDKRIRKQQIEAGTDKKTVAQAKEKAQRRKSTIIYSVVAALLVLFFAFVLIFNSSWPVRHIDAVEINGQKYTVAQLDYYYAISYMSLYNTYSSYASYGIGMPFDQNTSLAKQEYEDGVSWRRHLLDEAVENMTYIQMMNDEAQAAGFELSEEQQAELDDELEQMRTGWSGLNYTSQQQYLNMNYGKGVDMALVEQELTRAYIANAYAQSVYDSYEYADAELDDYYAEHADELDMIDYAYYTVTKPAEDTAEDTEEPAEETEESEAAEDAEQTEEPAPTEEPEEETAEPVDVQAMAKELDGTDLDAFTEYLAENVGEDAEPFSTTLPGASLSSNYSEWLLDSAREPGDVTAVETDNADYVVMFLGRSDNDYPTVSFRHILVQAEDTDGDGTLSDEEIQAAADEAQSIYDEWKDGDATEDSFAELANTRSDDSGSNTNGGLYENVYKGAMVQPINDWLFAAGRKSGDTTVVSNDGSYTGTHVVYFVGESDMTYARYQADLTLRGDAYTAWEEEAIAGYEATTSHLGMAGKLH